MKKFKTVLLLFVVLGATACLPPSSRVLSPPAPCVSWGELPLVLDVDDSAADYRDDVSRAARAWNDALGRTAFVWSYVDASRVDVLVAAGPAGHGVAEAAHDCRAGAVTTVVTMAPYLDGYAATNFAAHGLGHALGLGHSTNEQSVMQAELDVDLMGEWVDGAAHSYRILPTDAAIVRAMHPPRAQPPMIAAAPQQAAIPLLGVLIDFLLTKEGMALAGSALAWLFHRSVKSKGRQAKLLEYASQAFLVAEAMGVHEKLGGRDKYLRFVETIVTRLKTSGEPELSAKEMQLLGALASEKSWIAKPAAAR